MKQHHRTEEKKISTQNIQQEIKEEKEESEMEQNLLSEPFDSNEIGPKAIKPIRLVNPKDNI